MPHPPTKEHAGLILQGQYTVKLPLGRSVDEWPQDMGLAGTRVCRRSTMTAVTVLYTVRAACTLFQAKDPSWLYYDTKNSHLEQAPCKKTKDTPLHVQLTEYNLALASTDWVTLLPAVTCKFKSRTRMNMVVEKYN